MHIPIICLDKSLCHFAERYRGLFSKPGKITLMCGLSRLAEMLATRAMLTDYVAQYGGLPPKLTAFLQC